VHRTLPHAPLLARPTGALKRPGYHGRNVIIEEPDQVFEPTAMVVGLASALFAVRAIARKPT
jgi:hypothetical protein